MILNNIEVSIILRGEMIFFEPKGNANSESSLLCVIDAEIRKVGHRTGLDTPLFQSVNDADERWTRSVSMLTQESAAC